MCPSVDGGSSLPPFPLSLPLPLLLPLPMPLHLFGDPVGGCISEVRIGARKGNGRAMWKGIESAGGDWCVIHALVGYSVYEKIRDNMKNTLWKRGREK